MSTYQECKDAEAIANGVEGWSKAANLWLQCFNTDKEIREAKAKTCLYIADAIRKGDEFRATHQVCDDCNIVFETGKTHNCRLPTNHCCIYY